MMFNNSEEEPVSNNSGKSFNLLRDLDFKNNYSRFANKNMHYGIVDKEEFIHTNMQPNTTKRDFEVNDGLYQDRKLQIYSGVNRHYKHKKEVKPFFFPKKNLTNVHGAPVKTDELQMRYIPDMQKNHSNLPFENKVKIIPGINGTNQEGRNQVYRILPKSVDELRSKNDQKITYDAKKIHAIKKGELRGPDPTLTKYKLPDYREQKVSDLLPSKSTVNKQKLNGKIKKPSGNRSTVNNYVSHAKNTNKGDAPSKNKSQWKKTNKVTYMSDNNRNISNAVNKKQTNNKKSYTAYNTQRVTTNYEEKGNIHNNNKGSYAHDPNNIPLTTLRELMIHNENILGAHSTNGSKEYTFSKDMVLATTNRETTAENNYHSNVRNNEHAAYSKNSNDTARKTIRETTEKNQYNSNVRNNEHSTYSKNPNDTTRITVKQTTLHSTPHMNVGNMESTDYVRTKNMKTRPTIKQTTLHSTPHMNVGNMESTEYVRAKNMKARPTVKQTTLHSTPHMNIGNIESTEYIRAKNMKARPTIKETTHLKNYTGVLTGEVEKPRERTDVNNMCIDDRREILTYNRTPGGKHEGPHIIDKHTYEFKEPVQVKREYINKHRPIDRSVCDEALNVIYSRNKNKVKKIESDYRLNYDYISELNNNPLVNDLMHQKNSC